MKQKLDHVPERVTTITISNSQQFYEIQIPLSTGDNGGMASSANTNADGTHDASGSIHERVVPRHHQKKTIPNKFQQKGAQCSSAATPKRRTPDTSQHEDLLSGPTRRSPRLAASQDNDDDDFEPAIKRLRLKVPAHKDPKSKKSSLPSIQEEDDDGILGKINSCCTPNHVLDAINKLSEPQKNRVHELGWGKFLEIAIDCVESRNLFLYLLDRVDIDSMFLRVPPNIELPINKAAVHAVLGVPAGTEVISKKSSKELSNAKRELMAQLGIATNKITVPRLLEEVAKGNADDLSMKCFFLVIFNRFLFPGSAFDIANTDLQFIMDFQNFGKVDWQQAVIDHIRTSAKEWQSPGAKNTANPTIRSCAPFLLIYYLENLDHPLNDNNHRMVVPRAAVFSKQYISTLTNADRWADKYDRICYGKLRQKNPVGSAYQKVYTMQHTAVPASFQLPQLSDLLKGVLDNVAASTNPHFLQLITTVDRDIRANQKVIHELHHTNECLLIKFSEDVKELLANASIPTVTEVQHQTGQQTRPESSTRNLQEPTLQRNDSNLAGPSHTETATVQVEQPADATQPLAGHVSSCSAGARQEEIVAFRDEQVAEQEQPLTDLVDDHSVSNQRATANGLNILTMVCEQLGKQPHGSAHLDMGGHHEDSLIRKEHRWAAAMASHSVRGPSSSMQLPVTGSQTGVSQPLPMPIPIQVTPEDLDHKDAIDTPATPPATLSAAEIVTPEVGKTYTHPPALPEDMIPKVGLLFDTEEHAYEMFRRYAVATGFPIKWARKKRTVRDISCSMSGTWKYYKPEQQRTRNKFTKKTGCKVYMKLKHVSDMEGNYNGKVIIDKIQLDHNHPLSDELIRFE
ncbi:uncharacterized protein LOC8085124 isoform X2 [Sorghum bicolor]|uniref:FAR1 domain-containing protein n=1 Tax=Sorghum bicolor TaxID=4558 RepID=A0A1Z5R2K8_SORBI|nr:uncharacterized protein LOC8085124 isoform X2 [Sorghum bicolor]OQU77997.1 hypothetical protein SORBI_3009G135300 [Sorghum bicolor]|eukprot:XP_021304150.1 uncharacterized protein LOC8085124 isoform X2 [Sorghum bicolor]